MDQARWHKLERIIGDALELEPESRDAFLSRACGEDRDLLAEAQSLLSLHSEADDFLEKPVLESLAEATARRADRLRRELYQLGGYQILETLGEGGMGLVYLAEQTHAVRRRVALKVIKAEVEDAGLRRRFFAEIQALARMAHENVARIYEAATTPSGRPFFTMEYFPGEPITLFARGRSLGLRDRVALVIQACEGVAHAHQRSLLHRDIKPANILVADKDGRPLAKLIDFGVAKFTDGSPADEHSRFGRIMGTPAYMSPEQIDRRDVDTRADVYGLGATLYELLTGAPPFDPERLRRVSTSECLRIVMEETPPRPLDALRSGGGGPGLPRKLPRELEWIAMKALEKDRERRYPSAAALAEDLQRYLDDFPVAARRVGAARRLGKWARRHRAAAAAAAAVLAAVGFSLFLLWRDAARQRAEAARLANMQRHVAGWLASSTPGRYPPGAPIEVVLDDRAPAIAHELADDPLAAGALMSLAGSVYGSRNRPDAAYCLLLDALALQRVHAGPRHPDTQKTLERLASQRKKAGDYDSAERHFAELLAEPIEGLALRAQVLRGWADLLRERGRAEFAVPIYQDVLDIHWRINSLDDLDTLVTLRGLAISLLRSGQETQAQTMFEDVLILMRQSLGERNRWILETRNSLANRLFSTGHYREAEREYREIHRLAAAELGAQAETTLDIAHGLCKSLVRNQALAEAAAVCGALVEIRMEKSGPLDRDLLQAKSEYARLLVELGRLAEAERQYCEIRAAAHAQFGDRDIDFLNAVNNLADICLIQQRYAETEAWARSVQPLRRWQSGGPPVQCAALCANLGIALMEQGRYAEAGFWLGAAAEHRPTADQIASYLERLAARQWENARREGR